MESEFYIRGDNDREYGPVTLAELAEWVRENRVGVGTYVRRADENATWRRWEEFSELMALLTWNPPVETELVLAPFYKRALAFCIDVTFLVFSIGLGLSVGFRLIHVDPTFLSRMDLLHDPRAWGFLVTTEIIFMIARIVYFGFCHGRSGQTLGKRWLRIRVVDLSGQRISWRTSWWRATVSILSWELYGLGYLMALVTPKTRTLHDWAARTMVVGER